MRVYCLSYILLNKGSEEKVRIWILDNSTCPTVIAYGKGIEYWPWDLTVFPNPNKNPFTWSLHCSLFDVSIFYCVWDLFTT